MKLSFLAVLVILAFFVGDCICYDHAKFPERMNVAMYPGNGYVALYRYGTNAHPKPAPPAPFVILNQDIPTAVVAQEKKLTDAQKIALLRAEAHKRGLAWMDYCTHEEGNWQFQADAWIPGHGPMDGSYEDGSKDWWSAHSSTQAEAAYGLYVAIQGDANIPIWHRPSKGKEKSHEYCPPDIGGH